MNRRRTVVFCIVILAILTLACNDNVSKEMTKRKYTIGVADNWYYCDEYEWVGPDLMLSGCGWYGFGVEIKDATTVTIITQ